MGAGVWNVLSYTEMGSWGGSRFGIRGALGRRQNDESGNQGRALGSDGQLESLAWILCLKPGVWMIFPREWVQKR